MQLNSETAERGQNKLRLLNVEKCATFQHDFQDGSALLMQGLAV